VHAELIEVAVVVAVEVALEQQVRAVEGSWTPSPGGVGMSGTMSQRAMCVRGSPDSGLPCSRSPSR